jgi:hypothetical protein
MRQSQTAVIERKAEFAGDFVTEPFECGWAAEARWFVKVARLAGESADGSAGGSAKVRLATQISADGLAWTDHERPAVELTAEGLHSWPVSSFGQWLRLRGSVDKEGASATLTIYLALKS